MQSPSLPASFAPGRGAKLRQAVAAAKRLFGDDLWDQDVALLSGSKRVRVSICRIAVMVGRGFVAHNCGLQASALTYITLMSMIPVLALMFSFSKGIGMQNRLIELIGLQKSEIVERVRGHEQKRVEFDVAPPGSPEASSAGNGQFALSSLPEPLQKVVTTVFSYVENTSFGALGLVGSLLLLWGAVQAMHKLEQTFNHIWGVRTPRPLFRRFTEYFFVLALVPVLLVVVTSANAALSAPAVISRIHLWFGPLAELYTGILRLFGVTVIVGAFAFLYRFMPNTDVKPVPALLGGLVGGALWYATQWAYITFQIGVTNYNAIYGTFAAVPFFLAWLYTNWTIVLFGAEVSFAVQNYRTTILEGSAAASTPAARVLLGIVLTYESCKAFLACERGWRPAEFARVHALPMRLVASVATTLVTAGILVPVDLGGERERCYVPGKPPEQLTLADVEAAVRANHKPCTDQLLRLVPERVAATLQKPYNAFFGHLSTVTFRALVERENEA
jgi:membrane protein